MKNVSRNKCLLCFRPVVNMDLMLESEAVVVNRNRSRNHRAITNVTGTSTSTSTSTDIRNKGESKPSTTNSSVSDAKNSITIRRGGKKTFSQAIKAVVFETILAKRVRDRNRIDESESKGNRGTISSRSSSSLSTQNSIQKSEMKQNDEEGEMKPEQERTDEGFSSSKSVMCLLLIVSLAMTIFLGKFCAIISTSIWLYFLPRQQKQVSGVDGETESIKRSHEIEKDSRDQKKVIMEGENERVL